MEMDVFIFLMGISFVTAAYVNELSHIESFLRNKESTLRKKYRPFYHLTAPEGWISSPTGLTVFKRKYHLFYQYYPYNGALDALTAYRELCLRLTRGLHAERAAAAASAPHNAASHTLRERHRYAMRCAVEEASVARVYALSALESLPALLHTLGTAHARIAACWADLHTALRHANVKSNHR